MSAFYPDGFWPGEEPALPAVSGADPAETALLILTQSENDGLRAENDELRLLLGWLAARASDLPHFAEAIACRCHDCKRLARACRLGISEQ